MTTKHLSDWISIPTNRPENWQLYKSLFHPQASVPAVLIVEDVMNDINGYFFSEELREVIGEFPFKKLVEVKAKKSDLHSGIFIYKSAHNFAKTYNKKLCCPDNEYVISAESEVSMLRSGVKRRQGLVHDSEFKITPELFKSLKLGSTDDDILKLRLTQESISPKFLIVNLANTVPARQRFPKFKRQMQAFSSMEGALSWVNQDNETVVWSKVELYELKALFSPVGLIKRAFLNDLKDRMNYASGKPNSKQLEAVGHLLAESLIGPEALSL